MHGGWLDRLSFGCLNVGVYLSGSEGFPIFSPCLEHICAGGGGVVQIWILYNYVGGDYGFTSYIVLLV